jgi:hypothetical protein
MGACATQTFQDFSQSRFDCVIQKAQGLGVVMSGNEGQATKDGITIRWKFDPANKTLDLQCLDAPFFISCDAINQRIHQMADSCP